MEQSNCIYTGIDEHVFKQFEQLWQQFEGRLQPISQRFQTAIDAQHGVFHSWLLFQNSTFLIIKPEKLFVHSFLQRQSMVMRHFMPIDVKKAVQQYKEDEAFLFLFSYYACYFLWFEMDAFIARHVHKETQLFSQFFSMTNEDLENNELLQQIILVLNTKFIRYTLTQELCEQLYRDALEQTLATLYSTTS